MSNQKRLIIVSGLSGAGKTIALHGLEDLGYYCIDNLPAVLLVSAVDEVIGDGDNDSAMLAVGIDARNRPQDLESLPQLIRDFRGRDIRTDVLFLQASSGATAKAAAGTRWPTTAPNCAAQSTRNARSCQKSSAPRTS